MPTVTVRTISANLDPARSATKKAGPSKAATAKAAATKSAASKAAASKAAASKAATTSGVAGTGAVIELDDEFFGVRPNVAVMHQVVTAQLAHRRAGTQSTKTRAEVSGGGRKPFKQKGTGNARQGSTRAPHFSGGGVALGPKPRTYSQKTPKKMIKLALRSALSDRANDGKVVVVDGWGFDAPSTKSAVAALGSLGISGSVLVVHGREDIALVKSFRNLGNVQLIEVGELNAYDVLCNDTIVFTTDNLPSGPGAPSEGSPASTGRGRAAVAAAGTDVDGPYGTGSHAPTEDDNAPDGFEIKGNAQSMLYHTPESRYYGQTIAEVWFSTEEAALAAGFSKPGSQSEDADDEPATRGAEGSASDEAQAARVGSEADDEPATRTEES